MWRISTHYIYVLQNVFWCILDNAQCMNKYFFFILSLLNNVGGTMREWHILMTCTELHGDWCGTVKEVSTAVVLNRRVVVQYENQNTQSLILDSLCAIQNIMALIDDCLIEWSVIDVAVQNAEAITNLLNCACKT